MTDRFRIATYNIHKCKGLDLREDPDRIARVLEEIDADVIALQEVVSHKGKIPEKDQARFLADALGYELAVGENRTHRGGGYGNVLLSKLPIIEASNLDISVHRREPRGCLHTRVQLSDHVKLEVFNIHLGTAFFERRKQVKRLLDEEILDRKSKGPRIMLGDFNEWTHGLTSKLLKRHFRSPDLRDHLQRRRSYPGVFPLLHLDHIYYDQALRLEAARLHRSRTALIASDHLPLVADFHLAHLTSS